MSLSRAKTLTFALICLALGWWSGGLITQKKAPLAAEPETRPQAPSGQNKALALSRSLNQEPLQSQQWARLAKEARFSDAPSFVEWMERIDDLPTSESRHIARHFLLQAFEANPASLEEFLELIDKRSPRARCRQISLEFIGGEVAKFDAERAIRLVTKYPTLNGFGESVLSSLLLQGHSSLVTQFIEEQARNPNQFQRIKGVLEIIAQNDVLMAQSLLKRLPPSFALSVVDSIADSYGASAPIAGIEWAKSLEAKLQTQALQRLFPRWASQSPKEVFEFLGSIATTDSALAKAGLHAVFYSSRLPNPANLSWLEKNIAHFPSSQRSALLRSATSAFAAWLPELAFSLAKDEPFGIQSDLATAAAKKLGASDVGKAIEWVNSLADLEMKKMALSALFDQLRDPSDKEAVLQALPVQDPRFTEERLRSLAEARPEQALQEFGQLPTDTQAKLFGELSSKLMVSSLTTTQITEWLEKKEFPEEERIRFANRVGAVLAQKDIYEATQWAAALPPSDISAKALASVAQLWLRQNEEAARAWIAGFAEGTAQREGGLTAIARVEYDRNRFPEALEAALNLSNQAMKDSALTHIFNQWTRQNPEAARQRLNATAMSDELRRSIELQQD